MGKWVSVKDKYPNKNGRYLVCHYRGEDKMPIVQMALYDTNKDRYKWLGFEPFSVIVGVTHWADLPKPPKEVTET